MNSISSVTTSSSNNNSNLEATKTTSSNIAISRNNGSSYTSSSQCYSHCSSVTHNMCNNGSGNSNQHHSNSNALLSRRHDSGYSSSPNFNGSPSSSEGDVVSRSLLREAMESGVDESSRNGGTSKGSLATRGRGSPPLILPLAAATLAASSPTPPLSNLSGQSSGDESKQGLSNRARFAAEAAKEPANASAINIPMPSSTIHNASATFAADEFSANIPCDRFGTTQHYHNSHLSQQQQQHQQQSPQLHQQVHQSQQALEFLNMQQQQQQYSHGMNNQYHSVNTSNNRIIYPKNAQHQQQQQHQTYARQSVSPHQHHFPQHLQQQQQQRPIYVNSINNHNTQGIRPPPQPQRTTTQQQQSSVIVANHCAHGITSTVHDVVGNHRRVSLVAGGVDIQQQPQLQQHDISSHQQHYQQQTHQHPTKPIQVNNGAVQGPIQQTPLSPYRRCQSNHELFRGTQGNKKVSKSPQLTAHEILTDHMNQRLLSNRSVHDEKVGDDESEEVFRPQEVTKEKPITPTTKTEKRDRLRAEQVSHLCEIVCDLFIAESRLVNHAPNRMFSSKSTTHLNAGQSSFSSSPATRIGTISGKSPSLSSNKNSSSCCRLSALGSGDDDISFSNKNSSRGAVLTSIRNFVTALPFRYALGVNSPSEVLVHMRLMAAVKGDRTKAAVHIVNLDSSIETNDYSVTGTNTLPGSHKQQQKLNTRLVTISCVDVTGLLGYITQILGTGGSRVRDADLMISNDNVVLNRFVVEMQGRLRLDKVQQYVESFLLNHYNQQQQEIENDMVMLKRGEAVIPTTLSSTPTDHLNPANNSNRNSQYTLEPVKFDTAPPLSKSPGQSTTSTSCASPSTPCGPLYFQPPPQKNSSLSTGANNLMEEVQSKAIPLMRHIASFVNSHQGGPHETNFAVSLQQQQQHQRGSAFFSPSTASFYQQQQQKVDTNYNTNMEHHNPREDIDTSTPCANVEQTSGERETKHMDNNATVIMPHQNEHQQQDLSTISTNNESQPQEQQRLVDRPAFNSFSDLREAHQQEQHHEQQQPLEWESFTHVQNIPLEQLMLIEVLGTGRISTVYRAAWQQPYQQQQQRPQQPLLEVALKVTTTMGSNNNAGMGRDNIEELKREADIASQLDHPNLCKLLGIASDADCFCLAYEFCEEKSLSDLLSDMSRCYEYLPIALDIANGMAYLHSRNVIHRDLKPSNILLSENNRAKVSDFGMSVANTGQELTAETGTYRYMAPEVIRHESYSSNADVYSFGLVLWQLITRQVPFATMSPVQAAYAVAEGHRPEIPKNVPEPLARIIQACWNEDSYSRPSFTVIVMSLADYARMAFNPAVVGFQTVQIANDMLANVEGNSNVNVDYSAPVPTLSNSPSTYNSHHRTLVSGFDSSNSRENWLYIGPGSLNSDVGLEI
mmetsp:Transcript_13879/g.16998  ORF Transcript_13879/g.16998 Transcript_13879/m.16998 type:complete len:1403 (+) Transcript_13879:63-4271(+)